jgi:hypothetical protein
VAKTMNMLVRERKYAGIICFKNVVSQPLNGKQPIASYDSTPVVYSKTMRESAERSHNPPVTEVATERTKISQISADMKTYRRVSF